MKDKPKKMNYSIDVTKTIVLTDGIVDGMTKKKAAAITGAWVKLNPTTFALVEEVNTTIVKIVKDEIGCACRNFTIADTPWVCEHLIAFENLETDPTASIQNSEYDSLRIYLFELGWHSNEDRWVYPAPDAPTTEPEVVAELPPIEEEHPTEEPEPKMIERKCAHCGFVSKGYDRDEVVQRIAEHRKTCPENPANKKKSPRLVTQEAPEQPQEAVVKDSLTTEPSTVAKSAPVEKPSKKVRSLFDWIEELIEFGVGQIFGDTGTAKTAFSRELAEQAADEGKKVVYWDSEGNMTRKQRAAMTEHKNITYILDRDWDHIKNMLNSDLSKGSPKLPKCDLFILDSIGVPVLGIYGTLKQNQKGNALQAMQGLLYRLTKFAEKNDAVVIVTNQPVSEMNKTEEQKADRHPFGDKAMFFTKEILKIVVGERTEYKTVCHILAWRSRSAGRGKMLCTVTVSDSGVEVTPTGGV